jgi:enoyl-CoA hydratase/carnithine racemase
MQHFGDVTVEIEDDHVAVVEIHRPPNNFFDASLIRSLADAYEALDDDPACRVIVLCTEGKHFCAGASIDPNADPSVRMNDLYTQALRLYEAKTPVVAAVQGAAIGGGLGLACSADFRVAAPGARFSSNFARLGFHHGFGLSVSLPLVVGQQRAIDLMYTGRRVTGEEALAIGLCDRLAPLDEVRAEARRFAREIAMSAPLAVRSIRQTMRGHLADAIKQATSREWDEQTWLRTTEDFLEGIRAGAERRDPIFQGR